MKITVITLVYNEEKRLPFLLRHYRRFADEMIVYYNVATNDHTFDILITNPLVKHIIDFDTGGFLSEEKNLEIKNTAWKQFNSDWYIVIDADEFLYYDDMEDIRELLEMYLKNGIDLPPIQGYQMIGEPCPIDDGKTQIYDHCRFGTKHPTACKQILFSKNANIEYTYGGHTFIEKKEHKKYNGGVDLKLLHYRAFSYDYMKQFYGNQNLNPQDKRTIHYTNLIKEKRYYDELFAQRELVVK